MASSSIGSVTKFSGGIADSSKEGQPNSCFFQRSLDTRTDAKKLTLLPKTTNEAGTVITDLPMWGERVGTNVYIYGNTGNLYKRTSAGAYTKENTAASSSGNGLAYFGEDDYLYYPQDKTIGRFGPVSGSGAWYDDFLGSEGGTPTNTNSLQLLSASSQYADRADTASLSVTGDLTLEAYIKPTTLPASGSTMSLISKWDESGTTRSYIMDLKGVSASFGDGSDGALTISSNTTEAPIDSACSGTISTQSLSATNASFAAGQKILIIQMQGTGAGTNQVTSIQSYTAGTITTVDPLNATYTNSGSDKAQVRVLKQYTDVTINTGITYTVKAWNGTVGGVLAFMANGTVTVTGIISANGTAGSYGSAGSGGGFRGGAAATGDSPTTATQGEGTGGTATASSSANGNGGGGGTCGNQNNQVGGGGGGSNGTQGTSGRTTGTAVAGSPGSTAGTTDLTTIVMGGGGGGTSQQHVDVSTVGGGGSGGGIIYIAGNTVTVTGAIRANGGGSSGTGDVSGGGGGSILVKSQVATLGSSLITANGGDAEVHGYAAGGAGRVTLYYYTSYTGTTSPTLNAIQDTNLSGNTGYQVRLGVSSTGLNSEYLAKSLTIVTGTWTRLSISWQSSTSIATFYKDGVSLGTVTGTFTAIHDNASRFAVGKNTNSGASAANFYNGLIDDVRVWNGVRSVSQILSSLDQVLVGTESFIQGYWKFDNAYTDTTGNANTLTSSGSPTFSTDVPFSGITSRNDQDQQATRTGNTYTTPTSISEAAADKLSFVPAKDPQKSIRFYISAIGTGNWTVTIHDALNRTMASSTVTNANLNTGFYEFTFSSVWRPVIGQTYHAHITSTVNDGTVRTTTASDASTADYATFYQFLVSDVYHPSAQMLTFLAIGNERYLAHWDGTTYTPHKLTFPSGYRIRCLGNWREYLVIGTWRGTNITDYDKGRLFFWDGTSSTYNFDVDVPEGGINAVKGTQGKLYVWAGYSGDILLYMGGDEAQKIKKIPKLTTDKYVEILPGSVDMWRSLLHFGVSGNSDSTEIEKGVYVWGSLNRNYSESLTYDYPLSTGTRTGTTVKVGMVISVGQKLLIGWQTGVAYGVDVVDPTGSVFSSGTYELLLSDLSGISQTKLPLVLRADFESLTDGQSVTVKYKTDRESTWKTQIISDEDATENRFVIKSIAKEIQVAVDLATTISTGPSITGITLESDFLSSERKT